MQMRKDVNSALNERQPEAANAVQYQETKKDHLCSHVDRLCTRSAVKQAVLSVSRFNRANRTKKKAEPRH